MTQSPSPNPYTTSLSKPTTATPANYINPTSFQLISSGRDRIFGVGGQFNPTANDRLSDWANAGTFTEGASSALPADALLRDLTESDNLTNFNSSKLD